LKGAVGIVALAFQRSYTCVLRLQYRRGFGIFSPLIEPHPSI
jgi:hypothetical protein